MKNYLDRIIPERLTFSRESIQIVQNDPVLSQLFAENGYPAERLSQGLTYQEAARDLQIDQQVEYGNRIEATDEVVTLYQAVRKDLGQLRTLARFALERTPGLYEQLNLRGAVKFNRTELLQQGRHFYQEVRTNEDALTALAGFGITLERLDEATARLDALAAAMQQQQLQRGEAILATQRRQQAMRRLDDWMIQFVFVAKRILKDDPKQLEKLEIKA